MKLLIITGQMRSGTTLLTNYLNSQPNCVVYSDFLMSLFAVGKSFKLYDLHKQLDEREKNVLISNLEAEFFKFEISDNFFIERKSFNTWFELFELSMQFLSENSGKKQVPEYVGIKKTRNIYNLEQLLQNKIKIIHIYRDPRDVLLSSKNRFSYYHLFSFAQEWKSNIRKAVSLSKKYQDFKMIKYEDLLLNKDKTIDILSEFLEVSLNKSLSDLKIRKGVKYIHNSSFGDIKKAFDPSAAFRWKNLKNSSEVIFSYIFLKEEILDLNYEIFEPADKKAVKTLMYSYRKYVLKQNFKNTLLKIYNKLAS